LSKDLLQYAFHVRTILAIDRCFDSLLLDKLILKVAKGSAKGLAKAGIKGRDRGSGGVGKVIDGSPWGDDFFTRHSSRARQARCMAAADFLRRRSFDSTSTARSVDSRCSTDFRRASILG